MDTTDVNNNEIPASMTKKRSRLMFMNRKNINKSCNKENNQKKRHAPTFPISVTSSQCCTPLLARYFKCNSHCAFLSSSEST